MSSKPVGLDGSGPQRSSSLEGRAAPAEVAAAVDRLVRSSIELRTDGELTRALIAAEKADTLSRRASFPRSGRAEVLCALGAVQYKLGRAGEATATLSLAFALVDGDDGQAAVAAEILEWRSRCYRIGRDFAAAALDCERALGFAEQVGDLHQLAHVHFQTSLVAERSGDPQHARAEIEQALTLYEQVDDLLNAGRCRNNLGGLLFLLGEHEQARTILNEARAQLESNGHQAEAGQALNSLAQVELRCGEPQQALLDSEHALNLLDNRADFVDETGCAMLIRGRALMELCQFIDAEQVLLHAETLFVRIGSLGHQAAAWLALGDLALRRGDHLGSVPHYRRAAEAMQDVHF